VAGGVNSTGLNATGTGGFFNSANKFGVDNNAGVTRMYSSGSDASTRGSYDFRTTDSVGTLDTSRMVIDSSGNVGIGTTSPAGALDVRTAGSAFQAYVGTNSGTSANDAGIVFQNVPSATASSRSCNLYFDANGADGSGGDYFYISNTGDNVASIWNQGGGPIVFGRVSTESLRIDSSGRLLVGTSSARSNFFNTTISPGFQLEGTSTTNSANRFSSVVFGDGGSSGPIIALGKHRSSSVGGTTVVASGDEMGQISFQGSDGTEFVEGANIRAEVDGTPGADDMPGRLVFSTTADGAASPTERMRIEANGNARFSNLATIYPTTDDAVGNGGSGFRWSAIWAANGTIQTSDQRAKTDVTDAGLGSSFIKSLRPVSYRWIEGGKRDTGERDADGNYIYESVPGTRTHWGFIAQEVKEAVDAAGVDFGGWVLTNKDDPGSQQALRYDQFIAPLTKALQEAMERIEALEADVAQLKGE
jgi:hypothetical protein